MGVKLAGWRILWAFLIAGNLSAGTVRFAVVNVSPTQYQYFYDFSSFPFLPNEEFDVRFDPMVYASLANAQVGDGFVLVACCQVNNPPGTFGDYLGIAAMNIPAPLGVFRIDVTLLNPGPSPDSQPFFLNQLDGSGNIVSQIQSGFTVHDQSVLPEPANSSLVALGGLAIAAWWLVKKRAASRKLALARPGSKTC